MIYIYIYIWRFPNLRVSPTHPPHRGFPVDRRSVSPTARWIRGTRCRSWWLGPVEGRWVLIFFSGFDRKIWGKLGKLMKNQGTYGENDEKNRENVRKMMKE